MVSIVIAAYNEAAVIGRTLDSLLADAEPGELDIVVVANGCRDETASVAGRRAGVTVIELSEGSKPAALDAGDSAARGFPRVYLDADIVVSAADVRVIAAALARPSAQGRGHLAAAPRRMLEVAGRPLLVAAYARVHARHPALEGALFGRGLIALSEEGRARFDRFPRMVADDLFVDSLFSAQEKVEVVEVTTLIEAPWTTGDLLRRLERVRRGNAELRRSPGVEDAKVRPGAGLSWLVRAVAREPRLLPSALAYVGLTSVAELRARRAGSTGWGRDESTRGAPGGTST